MSMTSDESPSPGVIDCPCGARVRLPSGAPNRKFRCPKCKQGIALSVDAKVLFASPLDPRRARVSCPICQTQIAAEEFAVTCPVCDQVHHRECWAEVGGCGTYGCRQAPALEKEAPEEPLSAWGDAKTCPVCGEKIKAIAVRCRYCGSQFDTVDPLTLGDVRRQIHRGEAMRGLHTTIIVLFVLSLLVGCLAPIVAAVAAFVVVPKHRQLAAEGPLYLVLGYSAIALSAVYSMLMVGFAFL